MFSGFPTLVAYVHWHNLFSRTPEGMATHSHTFHTTPLDHQSLYFVFERAYLSHQLA